MKDKQRQQTGGSRFSPGGSGGFFRNRCTHNTLAPAFRGRAIPIVTAASNNYIPYVSVMLRSLVCNGSKGYNYDVVILHSNIGESGQQRLKKEFAQTENLSIRFFNVSDMLKDRKLFVSQHLTRETYYRLLIPDILPQYKRAVYLDSDLVVLDDIAKLYQVDMKDAYVAAVADVVFAGFYGGAFPSLKEYVSSILKMDDPSHYFNAGVLVMNLQQFRCHFTSKQIFAMAESRDWIFHDQDILNALCENHVYYLDTAWNVMMNWRDGTSCCVDLVMKFAPAMTLQAYFDARKNIRIAHFAGSQKPWIEPNCDLSDLFWRYARMTYAYEALVCKSGMRQNMAGGDVAAHGVNDDRCQISIPGIADTVYIDGLYIKLINKMNQRFPLGSKRRKFLQWIGKILLR